MLVSPVDFKKTLESLNEHLRFVEGALNDSFDAVIFSSLDFFISNPALGVKENRLGFLPAITLHIVPFFEGVSVILKILMFAPSSKALDLLKTSAESL